MGNCVRCRTTLPSNDDNFHGQSDDHISIPSLDESDNIEEADASEIWNDNPSPGEYTQFHFAAWNGETETVEKCLLREDFDYDRQTYDQNTPFALAAHGGHLEVFEILLKRGVNIHNADHEKDTPLHYAANNRSFTMVKKLIDHGAEVNVKNKFGVTPLWLAAYHGDVAILKLLLYHNADASMTVCTTGERLIAYGYRYDQPRSPLYVAVDKCAEDCVRTLISAGCDLNKETWLQEGDYPKRGIYDEENRIREDRESIQRSVSLLKEMASSPVSLLSICRTFLRHRLGKKLTKVVKDLEIPNSLVEYLTLAEFYREESVLQRLASIHV